VSGIVASMVISPGMSRSNPKGRPRRRHNQENQDSLPGSMEPVNPGGTASFGVVVKDDTGTVLLREHGVVGTGSQMSSNLSEYGGVLRILKYLSSRPPGRVMIHGDSNLVINQLNGKWRIKKGLYLSNAIETKELLAHLRGLGWQINFCWIPREQNEECDALSRSAGN